MAEPSSALTFQDLIIEVARKVGWAYYGTGGNEQPQVPTDAHDLAESKRIVNDAIRMFMADGPEPDGWRNLSPTASIVIWGSIAVDASVTVTGGVYDSSDDETGITASTASFYETMEGKTITITGVGDFTIKRYSSSTVVYVEGDASSASGATWSIDADGNYTLPRDFGGEYTGDITYAANTNQGTGLSWTAEGTIRKWRENVTDETGEPYLVAVRPMAGTFTTPRRRWELMAYPIPDEVLTVEFPYELHFDSLVELTDVPPFSYKHDDAIRAACRAKAEIEIEDVPEDQSPAMAYYRNVALVNSHRVDKRSAPRRLGSMNRTGLLNRADAFRQWRETGYDRPNVTFNT